MTSDFRRVTEGLLLFGLLFSLFFSEVVYAAEKKRKQKTPAVKFTISYFSIADEELYQKRRAYTGVSLQQQRRPLNGVKLGVKSAGVIGRSLGLKFELAEFSFNSADDPVSKVVAQLTQGQSTVAILDLPKQQMLEIAQAMSGKPVVLFNARHKDNDLRGSQCYNQLFHTMPSYTMLMDALNQYLKSKNWSKVLLLAGSGDNDSLLASAYKKSASKFSIKIVDEKSFVLSNDPRDRSKTNVSILTGRPKHDVIFVADTLGEFARYVPYQTHSSRLVVGSEGLIPDAWHWAWERHGAPQLNQRFDKKFDARLSTTEWAGWAAVKATISAVRLAGSTDHPALLSALSSSELVLDLYKGTPGSFRAWNNQLRQPILLHTHNAVVARAPLDGYLHHRTNMDTLGIDEGESTCVW